MNPELPIITQLLVFGTIVFSVLIGIMNSRENSLTLSVLYRWCRWLSISMVGGFIFYQTGWTDRPFWALAVIFFLLWLLLETVYTWLAISALSQSSLSLFPRFRENETGEEWPANRSAIELRDWLRANNFERSQALVADVGGEVQVRSSVFENKDKTIRVQVLFVPQRNGTIAHCLSFASETPDGNRQITDNLFTPYGGFYPENWSVIRKPWNRKASKLFKIHSKRIRDLELAEYEVTPLEDINQQQILLERTNIDAGFLFPPHLHDEMGRITWEGRYRVWKEVWLLNYLGIPNGI